MQFTIVRYTSKCISLMLFDTAIILGGNIILNLQMRKLTESICEQFPE